LTAVCTTVLIGGCAITPHPLTSEELNKQAQADRAQMFDSEPLTAPLTLADAISRALKYNLDKRARMMEEALAFGQLKLDQFDMLPKLTVDAGYAGRSDHGTVRSTDAVTGLPALGNPYFSLDKNRAVADLSLSWNILDFGVSYYTAHQNADKALIATERRRKTTHNLVQAVRFAYWRAVAHQVLEPEVTRVKARAQSALEHSRTVQSENVRAPEDSLRYERALFENVNQLTAIEEDLSTAPVELASLIGVPPGTELILEVPQEAQLSVPQWTMPIEEMEQTAFVNNPDLREQGYLARIAVNDTRKALLRLLPGINFLSAGEYDSNSFLSNNFWYQGGAQLSWNLLNMASAPAQISLAHKNEDMVNARRMALRMAVLAQVHISGRQFHNAVDQYQQSAQLAAVDEQIAKLSAIKTANDVQGELGQVADESASIATRLRRFHSYAQLQAAYATLRATLGDDLLPSAAATGDLPSLSKLVAARLQTWSNSDPAPAPIAMLAPDGMK
jgi:hypothetical protein